MMEPLMRSQVEFIERDIRATMRMLVRQIEVFGLSDLLNETYNSLTRCLEDVNEQCEKVYEPKFFSGEE